MEENDFSISDAPTMRPEPVPGGGRRLAAGDTILGRYAVVRELGEGGMGVVYQCLDTVGGVDVAVKGLPPEVSRNEDEMDDIRANYQIVRKLRHPNIAGVATLEKDPDAGDYYLVMDLAAGTTLKRWARRHPDAGLDAKLAILRQVAAALDYAHGEKVIHRDVKPENVMVDDDGRVKVLDFGLAAQIRSSQSRTSNMVTSKGGTPGYKSPEQWLGRPQQAPADVYAFGVMAYWLFAGHLPFDGDDPVVLGHAVLTAPVEPIPDLPARTNAALVKALAKEPKDRFASCGAFVDALEGRLKIDDSRLKNGGGRPRGGAWKALLAVAALGLAVAGGWWYVNARVARSTIEAAINGVDLLAKI
jgi:serine/threonine-protein kinase